VYSCVSLLQIYYQGSKSYSVVGGTFDESIQNIDTPDNTTSFIVTGLIPTTNYAVNLTAFTGAGEGNFSVIFTILTGGNGK